MKKIISDFRYKKTDYSFNVWFSVFTNIAVWFCIGSDTHYLPFVAMYK